MDFWEHFEQVNMDTVYLYHCLVCGSVVNDWTMHIAWHEKIEGKIA